MTDRKDEQLHRELVQIFRDYFEENQTWHQEDTLSSSIRLRKLLSRMRELAKQRSWDINQWQKTKRQILRQREDARVAAGQIRPKPRLGKHNYD